MKKIKLYGKKDVRTAAYNRSAARFFLHLADKQVEGRFFSTQASIVFSAFTHEAFLNTLGPKVLTAWSEHEYASTACKLRLICKQIAHEPHTGKRPYQTLKILFLFRNLIAHGREETIQVEGRIVARRPAGGYLDAIESEWERYCTAANARRAYHDVRAIAEDLCSHASVDTFPGMPFGSAASAFFKIEYLDS